MIVREFCACFGFLLELQPAEVRHRHCFSGGGGGINFCLICQFNSIQSSN